MAAADTYRFDPIAEQHDLELGDMSTEQLLDVMRVFDGEDATQEQEEVAVRHLLLRYAANEKQGERLTALRDEVVRPYNERLRKFSGENDGIRDVIKTWLLGRGVNSIDFPGLYKPTLSTVKKGGKAKIEDPTAFKDHLVNAELEGILTERTEMKAFFDANGALEDLLADSSMEINATGEIVNTDTGETISIPGVIVESESKTLQMRGAA
jgi:hypothetical protein